MTLTELIKRINTAAPRANWDNIEFAFSDGTDIRTVVVENHLDLVKRHLGYDDEKIEKVYAEGPHPRDLWVVTLTDEESS